MHIVIAIMPMPVVFPVGTRILESDEDADSNRTFIIVTPGGSRERWVRCGQTGRWLEWHPL